MAQQFENLEVWKRSARLSAEIYRTMAEIKDWGFRDQITRAGLSVPSNIAEGYERENEIQQISKMLAALIKARKSLNP